MKIAVISAVTGGMDQPKRLPPQSVKHQFFFFTDKDVPREYRHLDKRTQALYFKQQMHRAAPGFDVYIWLDGKIQIDRSDFISQCITALGNNDIAILKHGERDCVYDELNYILAKLDAGVPYFVARFYNRRYRLIEQGVELDKSNYPKHNGLHDCSIMVWRSNITSNFIANRWFSNCHQLQYFDQVEIHFSCWLHKVKISTIEFKPETFHLVKHQKIQ